MGAQSTAQMSATSSSLDRFRKAFDEYSTSRPLGPTVGATAPHLNACGFCHSTSSSLLWLSTSFGKWISSPLNVLVMVRKWLASTTRETNLFRSPTLNYREDSKEPRLTVTRGLSKPKLKSSQEEAQSGLR